MRVLTVRNANAALAEVLQQISQYQKTPNQDWSTTDSRNGQVIKSTTPFTTVYLFPNERVNFDVTRNASPFFHYLESLWMLAGREDVAFPAYYAANIANYSDDGKTLNGAYGYRWLQYFGEDQISILVNELIKDPLSRRCILQMWSAQDPEELHDGEQRKSDLNSLSASSSRDVCCNLSVVFQARKAFRSHETTGDTYLDMTVYNRSNDIVYGAYGANSVHFSVLHEYICTCVGIKMGTYYQVSNNFHTYTEFPIVKKLLDAAANGAYADFDDLYTVQDVFPTYLFEVQPVDNGVEFHETTIKNLENLFYAWDTMDPIQRVHCIDDAFCNRCFGMEFDKLPSYIRISLAMITSYEHHKMRDYTSAKAVIDDCLQPDSDWRYACLTWLDRREANFKLKGETP